MTTASPRRFLFVLWEGAGSLPPELGLAQRLVERGHTVHVLADPCIADDARAAGCSFTSYTHAPHRTDRSLDTDFIQDWHLSNPLEIFARQRDRLVFGPARLYARDVLNTLAQEPADALVIDVALFGAMVAAEQTGLPTALLMPHCYLYPAPGVPTPGPGFFPARGPIGMVRDAIGKQIFKRLFATGLPALNAARREFNLAALKHPLEQLDRADRLLVLTSQAFDFEARRRPANVRYVGPQLDDPAWVQPWQSPWSADQTDPLVIVGFSTTFQDQSAILQRLIDAMATLPVRGLVTVGPVIDPTTFRTTPNVAVVASAPHTQVFPLASAVVTHAGHGTVIRALAQGLPLVCIPMGHDQGDTATRVAARGAGLKLTTKADVTQLREAIRRVLDEPGFRENAQRLSNAIKDDMRRGAAITELETLAARTPQPAPVAS